MAKIERTFDLLTQYGEEFQYKEDALVGKENGKWVKYSSGDYIRNSNLLSYALLTFGIKKGDIIATITNNRPEWNFADMGIAQIGAIHLPIFTTLNEEGYRHILLHANPKMIIVGGPALYKKIKNIKNDLPEIKIYSFDESSETQNWNELLDLGKSKEGEYLEEVERIKSTIEPDDWATLLYTSGTTGNSKGVKLSHRNLVSNARAASEIFNLKPDHKYLSILPLCHVGERMANYQTQFTGCSLYYAENIGSIARDLKDIQPQGFGAVPRILEKVYDKIMDTANQLTGIKRKLFFWAMNIGYKYDPTKSHGPWYGLQLWIANKIIFNKWRAALGNKVQFIGVGGAVLPPKIERVFWAAGIKLLNMYGLSETSPIITINRSKPPLLKLGSVGAVIDDVELKIAEDGEILVKGPNVMMGYFKDEEATQNAIDKDGWFHTGDIGILEDNIFLTITDRKKEVFKLSNGKYIMPQVIENKLKESMYIDQSMVIGEGEKFPSALVSPDFEALKKWAKKHSLSFSDKINLIKEEAVIDLYKHEINDLLKNDDKDSQLKRIRLVPDEWTPDTGELSPTLKLKRRVLREKYAELIAEIFIKE